MNKNMAKALRAIAQAGIPITTDVLTEAADRIEELEHTLDLVYEAEMVNGLSFTRDLGPELIEEIRMVATDEHHTFCDHSATPAWDGRHESSCYTRPPSDTPSAMPVMGTTGHLMRGFDLHQVRLKGGRQ